MSKFLSVIRNYYNEIYKALIFIAAIILIVYMLPKEAKFNFEYSLGRPWKYETLIADEDFPVMKSKEDLEKEKQEITKSVKPYFVYDEKLTKNLIKENLQLFDSMWVRAFGFNNEIKYLKTRGFFKRSITKIYKNGIVDDELPGMKTDKENVIYFVKDKMASERFFGDFVMFSSVEDIISAYLMKVKNVDKEFLREVFSRALQPNVFFDKAKTDAELETLLKDISPWDAVVQQGQLIISKGEVVDKEKYRILESFRKNYEKKTGKSYTLIVLGQVILVTIPLFAFVLFLLYFRRDYFDENKNIILYLALITLMVFVSRFAVKFDAEYLYIVPLVINVLVIRAFYDTRLALMIHLTTVLLVSYFVPNSFQFLFLQVITGIITIISIVNLYKRSQFFLTALYIFLSYSVMYVAMVLITLGDFAKVEPRHLLYFAFNAMMVLFAYPLIYLIEKIFGMITDISLLEYADTNNDLIRELASKAPGTFQHSVQVANLAEEAIREIGGNPLLVRAGAMYHDIGKSLNPVYFTENQPPNFNPHDDLSFDESAHIIIDHVINGVEIARKNKIPEQIIDFIRTHHGTKRVEYFYRMSLKELPEEEVDVEEFTYKGPIPYSRETCVLMMADAVEAASRSIKDPDSQKISNLVDNIIKSQMDEGQYNNTNITMRDITTVKRLFKKRLMSIYHVRIEYPD